jgi:ubiquinone/menaquinone biosynthesis C-methylase UbiE
MPDSGKPVGPLPDEAIQHYAEFSEAERLSSGANRIELARTQELITRYVPPAPALIYDIGGGPGVYACWLARLGYSVHLVDAHPRHVEQAQRASAAQPQAPLASASLGDARQLVFPDASGDLVLLLGPLYHLIARSDRVAALREARRVVRPGGLVLAAAISRYASALDGMRLCLFDDPVFLSIVEQDVQHGQHRNPTNNPEYFTTTYFHHPTELRAEAEEAGLTHEATLAIEGPTRFIQPVLERWDDPVWRERILSVLRWIDAEPSLLGASSHLLAVARRSS